ncbi:MAG: peptide chain release factor N(5)-glutamine methyltransferase [Woeseiaceae bacterium]|nr:peptide chain release factor N(5)-glutamine methyltransferase [Woeseiaceae bacterium]
MNEFVRIADALAAAIDALEPASDSPRLDAELLLARAIDVPRSYLVAHPEDSLDPDAQDRFRASLEQRRAGMPMAYITGMREFWSLELMVTPATLVPRPETELLVEQVIGYVPRRGEADVLDLGTGSGAVAIAVAKERPCCRVVATDVSEEAVAVARENARQHDVANVTFVAGDWTEPVRDQRFDVVASNPPYVRDDDPALESLAFEPRTALAGGEDGLRDIRRIAAEAPDVTKPDGVLLIEHGADQSEAVQRILREAGWTEVRDIRDLSGHPRVAFGRKPS